MEPPDPDPAATDGAGAGSSRQIRWGRWLVAASALVAIYLGVAAWMVLSAASQVEQGWNALIALAAADPLSDDLVGVRSDVIEAAAPISSGTSTLESPVLWPLRPLPVVGRQISAIRSVATSAEAVVADAVVVIDAAVVLESAAQPERMAALGGLEEALIALNEGIDDADLGPDHDLVASVADARASAVEQLAELQDRSHRAEAVVRGLRSFLSSSEYLLMAANTNEMQIGGGTPLSLGSVAVVDGEFSVSSVETVLGIEVPPDLPAVDPDVAALWGFLSPTNDFKKLMLSSRFDAWGGPQALVLYEATFGQARDGTLLVDPVALQALLRVVGPVEVGGDVYDADNVLRYIYVDQYDQFELGGETTDNLSTFAPSDALRRDRLAEIAAATVSRLTTQQWDPLQLIEALRPVAEGRHVLAYSSDPVEQALWDELGIAGTSDGDEIGLALLNIGANKIDTFVEVTAEVTQTAVVSDAGAEQTRLDVAVTVANNTPDTLDEGITGYYWETLGLPTPASYLGRLAVLMPASTVELDLAEGQDLRVEAFGRDGPTAMIVVRLEPIPEGTSTTVRLRALLDGPLTTFEVLPSARHIPIRYDWDGLTFSDGRRIRPFDLADYEGD